MDNIDIMNDSVLWKLVESSDIAVPEELVKQEVELRVQDLARMFNLQLNPAECEDIMINGIGSRVEEFREEAIRSIKTDIFLRKFIEDEDIGATPEELEAEGCAIAERQNVPIEMARSFLGEDFQLVKYDVQLKKALELIHERNK